MKYSVTYHTLITNGKIILSFFRLTVKAMMNHFQDAMYYFIETYGTQRREDYRTVLPNQLNSNKAFQPGSTFQAYLTVFKTPKKGGNSKFILENEPLLMSCLNNN